jgi:hypothetical protein
MSELSFSFEGTMYISCLESLDSSVVMFQMEFHRVSRLFFPPWREVLQRCWIIPIREADALAWLRVIFSRVGFGKNGYCVWCLCERKEKGEGGDRGRRRKRWRWGVKVGREGEGVAREEGGKERPQRVLFERSCDRCK